MSSAILKTIAYVQQIEAQKAKKKKKKKKTNEGGFIDTIHVYVFTFIQTRIYLTVN